MSAKGPSQTRAPRPQSADCRHCGSAYIGIIRARKNLEYSLAATAALNPEASVQRMLELKVDIVVAVSAGETFDIDMEWNKEPVITPSDDADVWLQLAIGPKNQDWTETFSVRVVTPNRMPPRSDGMRIMRIHSYSHDILINYLVTAFAACERDTWDECLEALRATFLWEWDTPNRQKNRH